MPYVFEGYAEPESAEKGYTFEGYAEPSFAEKHGFKGMGLKKPLSVINAGLKGILEGVENINPLQPNISAISAKGRQNLREQFLPSEEGTEESIARVAGHLAPIPLGAEGSIASKGVQTTKNILKASKNIPKNKVTMASGLSQPKSVGSKVAPYASIGSKTEAEAIQKLNTEAGELAKKSIHKNLPLSKKIEEGFDFQKNFETKFGELESIAKKANPRIDITPVTELMQKSADKYRGIASPHREAVRIKNEVKAFYKKPPTSLHALYKTYRSNNQKINNIYETSRLTGKQKEYADFLLDQNRAIVKSFENTLGAPKGSWADQFKQMNKQFEEWKKADKALKKFDPYFRGALSPSELEKFAFDIPKHKKMALDLGKQATDEIVQLSRDLKLATESIKRIPKAEIKKWEAAFPLSFFIPIFGKAIAGVHGARIARHSMGYWLSKPATRRAYGDAMKAIKNQDFDAYKDATALLLKHSLQNEDD